MTLDANLARERLHEARLYLLLTRDLCLHDPLDVVEEALEAGVGLLQVREPTMPDRQFLEWVHDVRERAARHRIPVLVNDRLDVALLAGADGLHVGQDDLPPRAVRELWGPERLLGLSTHSLYDVTEADQEPVDYIGLGPIFDSVTKDVEGFGVDLLHSTLDAATRPVFGIGGINPDNLRFAVDAGLRRIAVSSAICSARDPGAVVERLMAILDGA